jgi:UDP-N-acetyl-D-mannosaminuronate dehydrogenase
MAQNDVVVAGLGEVGAPLFDLVAEKHSAIGVDIEPAIPTGECAVLHICYPFSPSFVETTVKYIGEYGPALTVINSTVAPGTTRAVHKIARTPIAYSPVRGKHYKMKQDLLSYVKFIGPIDRDSGARAEEHFESIGLRTKLVSSPETAELAKVTETTYFGLLIAWAQEVSRYCDRWNADYGEVASFYEEISFLPRVRYTPGVIGGHCVMPNIDILKKIVDSDLLDAIISSNEMQMQKAQRAAG